MQETHQILLCPETAEQMGVNAVLSQPLLLLLFLAVPQLYVVHVHARNFMLMRACMIAKETSA